MQIITWFSLASASGLSVVSLGTPGLKSGLDEQVFTGGISAVSHLLSEEIGSQEKTFIGGGDARKFGRFILTNPQTNSEIISQFLMMSSDGTKIPDYLVALGQEIAINFANQVLPQWETLTSNYQTLGPLEALDLFLEAVNQSKKKVKVISQDNLYETKFIEVLKKLTQEYQNSVVLMNIKEENPDFSYLQQKLPVEQSKLLSEFTREVAALLLLEDPTSILLRNRPSDIIRDGERILKDYINKNVLTLTINQFTTVSSELFKSGEVSELLADFSVFDIRKSRVLIQRKLENEFITRLSKRSPFILLINPTLESTIGSYEKFISTQVDLIFQEYDLASVLGKITSILLEGDNPLSQFLLSEFVRSFAMRFPGGLSIPAWKFVQTLFQIFSNQTGKTLDDAVTQLEISQSHLETINLEFKEVTPSDDLQSLTFTVTREGDDIIKFYSALETTISEGAQNFFDEAIWTKNQLGIFSQSYAEKVEMFVAHSQSLIGFLNILKKYYNSDWDSLSIPGYIPTIEELMIAKNTKTPDKEQIRNISLKELIELWKPEYFVKACYNAQNTQITSEFSSFISDRDQFKTEAEKLYTDVQEFLNADNFKNKPPSIEKVREKKSWDGLTYSEPPRKELWKAYIDFQEKMSAIIDEMVILGAKIVDSKKKPKDFDKIIEKKVADSLRFLEVFKKRIEELEKRVKDTETNIQKKFDKDYQRLHRELKKVYQNSILDEYRISLSADKNVEGLIIPDLKKVCSSISGQIEKLCQFEQHYPRTEEASLTYANVLIFNQIPRNLFNDAIITNILGDSKNSPSLTELVQIIRQKSDDRNEENNFAEELKKLLRKNAEHKIKIIIETIINTVTNAYFKGILKSYPLFKNHVEVACLDLGEITSKSLAEKFANGIPETLGPKLNLQKTDDRYHLLLEIEVFPSSGSPLPITKCLKQAAWNTVIADQLGLYLEILKMSSELLGESRRKKFQTFIEDLFEIIYT